MLKISVDAVIQKIQAETGLSVDAIKEQIKTKVKELEGLVSEEGAAFIIAAEMGVQVMRDSVAIAHKISELKPGAKDIEIVGVIDRLYRTIDYVSKGIAKQVASIQISDETGSIRVVLWEDKAKNAVDLKRGQKIKVKGSQVKLSRDNLPELHVGKYSTLLILQEAAPQVVRQTKLADLKAGEIVSILADVVQVREPKLYFVCPTCNKKVIPAPEGFLCPDHKKILPKENVFCSFVLDDGTATIRSVVFGKMAEEFLGLKIEDIKASDAAELLNSIHAKLLGKTVLIDGRVKENKNFSCLEIAANRININPDAKEIAVNLMEKT